MARASDTGPRSGRAAHGVQMEDTVAYADNWSDRALLEKVGRAVVVRPRGRLLRLREPEAGTSFVPDAQTR